MRIKFSVTETSLGAGGFSAVQVSDGPVWQGIKFRDGEGIFIFDDRLKSFVIRLQAQGQVGGSVEVKAFIENQDEAKKTLKIQVEDGEEGTRIVDYVVVKLI